MQHLSIFDRETPFGVLVFFVFLYFFCLILKKKLKKLTNCGPPRTSGFREQCKQYNDIGAYINCIDTGFFNLVGSILLFY